jgi:predicted dehydrogenase
VTGAIVVGTGFGCFTHVRALQAAGFEVHALVGRDPAKTARRAEAVGVPHACGSLTQALRRPGTDAVTIATPPHTHAPLVLEAIRAGRHVLCEKPFARDAAEGRVLLAAAQAAGIVHLLGTEFRFDTGQALLARAVRDGMVGVPRLALIILHVPVLAEREAELPDWWADAEQGGGWLGAHGSQVIDQIRTTLGEFEAVTGSVVNIARPTTADDGFAVHFRMRSGVVGMMQSTAADRGPMSIETRVIGTRGTAWIESLGDGVRVADASGTRQLAVPDELRTAAPAAPPRGLLTSTYERMIGHGLDLGPFTRLAEHFRARIEGVAPPAGPHPATFEDGVADMTVLDAVRRSATEGRTITIAPPDALLRS